MTDPLAQAAEVDRERFWSHVDKSGDCWIWTASLRGGGYGSFWIGGRSVLAHRQAYLWEHGSVPAGAVLDHLCRNRRCVRPSHIEAVSNAENVRRGATAFAFTGKCLAGLHEAVGDNIYVQNRGTARACRACKNERARRRRSVTPWRAADEGGECG